MDKNKIILVTLTGSLLAIFAPPLLRNTSDFLAGLMAGMGAIMALWGLYLLFSKRVKK